MSRYIKILIFTLSVLMVFPAAVFAEAVYPEHTQEFFVNDYAGVLGSDTEKIIFELGSNLEQKTGVQAVVVTINSLEGKSIEEYALGLFREWGIGQKDKNNGVLILNAVQERKIDIETGYAIEGVIPDLRGNEIIKESMTPFLKNGDYDNGILNGYIEVLKDVSAEYGVTLDTELAETRNKAQERESSPEEKHGKGLNLTPIAVILFLIADGVFFRFKITSMIIKIIFWSNIFRGGRGGRGGGGWGGFGGGSGGSWGGGSSGGGGSAGGGGSSGSY